MFCVIYSFEVVPGKASEFITYWRKLTNLIYQYGGSLGSRLHKKTANHFIAYAQWPDKKTWQQADKKLPHEAKQIGDKMRQCCTLIETIHELEVTNDLLKATVN